jgi:hypothetical protein
MHRQSMYALFGVRDGGPAKDDLWVASDVIKRCNLVRLLVGNATDHKHDHG